MALGRLYRADVFEPVGQILDRFLFLGGLEPLTGDQGTPWWEIEFVEQVVGLGTHATVVLWDQTGAAVAGYSFPTGAAQGTINAGASLNSSPTLFQMRDNELLQFRFLGPRIVRALTAGAVIDDIDIQVNLPTAVSRFGVQNDQGRWSAMFSPPLPGDSAVAPAQGANLAIPAAFPSLPHWAQANLNELFVFGRNNQPTWKINNNSSVNLAAGSLGINVAGFRYTMRNMRADEIAQWPQRFVFGALVKAPPMTPTDQGFLVIPTTGAGF